MKPIPLEEYDEQCLLVDYLELKHLKFSKIAQETFTKNWGTVMRNKRSGVRKGLPDILIIIPKNKNENKLLFIEMKRTIGGTVSVEQQSWIDALNKIPNVLAVICYGFDEAKLIIDKYL